MPSSHKIKNSPVKKPRARYPSKITKKQKIIGGTLAAMRK